MNRTSENLITWGSLGIGVGLLASGHKKAGWAVVSIAPATMVILHPRGTLRALRAIPQTLQISGQILANSGKLSGSSMWRSAELIGKTLAIASKLVGSAA
jgi:hypothetical protein